MKTSKKVVEATHAMARKAPKLRRLASYLASWKQ